MRISGKEADEREAAIRDGSRVGYFGSWEVGEEDRHGHQARHVVAR
jgi:hypothetical protein